MPLYQYSEVVRRQRLRENWLSPDLLREAFQHLVVEADVLSQIGPAVNSNKSFLIYGQLRQRQNGARGIACSASKSAPVYMPYAVECQGNIIQIYDPIYHQEDRRRKVLALGTFNREASL